MKSEQASMQVRNYLGALAMRGELKPGDRLPTERQLARKLCVSRTSLREGIAHLTTFGVLKSIRGVGTFVAADLHHGPLGAFSEFHHFPAWQMFETRLAIEPHVAALAAKRATKRQIADLGDEIAGICEVTATPEQHQIHNVRFHRMIALASGNPVLSAMIEATTGSSPIDEAQCRHQGQLLDFTESINSHREIYCAIRLRDPTGARLAMERHLQLSRADAPAGLSDQVPMLTLAPGKRNLTTHGRADAPIHPDMNPVAEWTRASSSDFARPAGATSTR